MRLKKKLSAGIEDYKKIIDKSYYYVDKTLLIKELLDRGNSVNLLTRPRRFGKTLALHMIKTFFEKELDASRNEMDNRHYFKDMKILECGEEYTRHMGQYPVISLSLKSSKQPDFCMAYEMLKNEISKEYERHRYVLEEDILIDSYKERYRELMNRKADRASYAVSLEFLSDCLKKYHKQDVIILIDEYDVPLENAYFRGFYDDMVDFVRSLFESALKTNDSLEFAVITGCLRISKESIFTGLNNLKVISILDDAYAEYFGFMPQEVQELLDFYAIREKEEEVRRWYDGYLFGNIEVYNPWSVMNYVEDVLTQKVFFPKPYWSNTSSNGIVRELIDTADSGIKREIEALIAGESIEKPIHEDITYEDIHESQDNLWNFLFFTGYLKMTGQRFAEDTRYIFMAIPNAEIRYIYRNTIREWFDNRLKQVDFGNFYAQLLQGNCEKVEAFLLEQLSESISYYDNAEAFYHGYLVGILGGLKGYELSSNKESGNGRPDIVLSPFHPKHTAVIIEIKRTQDFNKMEELCDLALRQIEERQYDAELLRQGYRKILKYGFCFCRKTCTVKCRLPEASLSD